MDNAKQAVSWVCRLCMHPELVVDELQNASNIYDFIKSKKWFGGRRYPENKSDYYNVASRTCAWFVENMLSEMGLLESYTEQVGNFHVPSGYSTKLDTSSYFRAYEFFAHYQYPFGDYKLRYSGGSLIWQTK